MLEGYHDLRQIEQQLRSHLSSLTLLGQMPLDEQDLQLLRRLLRSEMANGFSHVSQSSPLSFSCFLVQVGIREYDHGTFWPRAARELSFPEDSPRWGAAFLDTLQRYKLTTFPHVSGHKYVVPILLHGGIPESCLANFFEQVLYPIVSNRLDTETSDAEQLVAEWRETSHYHQTNKPVRRFLEDGGKPAADLLTRCVEMARTAHYEGRILPASELGLPERVAQQFGQWWPEYRQPMLSEQSPRLNRPWIERDLYGEVRCVLPEQTLSEDKDDDITFQVTADVYRYAEQVSGYLRGNVFLTEPAECSLPPARNYSVRLLHKAKLLREWNFAGLTADDWIAFDEKGRLLSNNRLPRAPFWLIFSQELDEALNPVEKLDSEMVADSRWAGYCHYLLNPDERDALTLIKQDGTPVRLPLAEDRESELHGRVLPHCHVGELPVYTDELPALQIPVAQSEWDVIVEDLTGPTPLRRWQALKDLTFELQQNQAVVPLSQEKLLGKPLLGEYRVTLRSRGTLGRDQQFRFAFIRNLDCEFDQPYYLTHGTPRLTLMTEPSLTLSSEDPAVGIVRPDELAEISFTSGAHSLSLNVIADNQRKLALTLLVPRLRWTLRGLANHSHPGWLSQPLTAQREDFEASDEIILVVQLPGEDNPECTIELAGTQHRVRTLVRHGEARFSLRQFYDSLRSLTTPIARFTFTFTDSAGCEQKICPLLIRTRWVVDRFECRETRSVSFAWDRQSDHQRHSHEQRTVTFILEDSGRFQQRQIRLWNLLQPWEPPHKISLPDGCARVEISEPLSSLFAGRYRVELFTEGEFEIATPLFPPRSNNSDVFDIRLDESDLFRRSLSITSFRDHLVCRLDDHESHFDLNNYILTLEDREDLARTLTLLIVEGMKNAIEKLWFEDLYSQIGMKTFRISMREWLKYFVEDQDDEMRTEMLNLCKVIGLAVHSLIPFQTNTQIRFKKEIYTFTGVFKWENSPPKPLKPFSPWKERPIDLLSLKYLNGSSRMVPLSKLDEMDLVQA